MALKHVTQNAKNPAKSIEDYVTRLCMQMRDYRSQHFFISTDWLLRLTAASGVVAAWYEQFNAYAKIIATPTEHVTNNVSHEGVQMSELLQFLPNQN